MNIRRGIRCVLIIEKMRCYTFFFLTLSIGRRCFNLMDLDLTAGHLCFIIIIVLVSPLWVMRLDWNSFG